MVIHVVLYLEMYFSSMLIPIEQNNKMLLI